MLQLSKQVKIGGYSFTSVNEVSVSSSWEQLTDTCKIVFPRKISWKGRDLATGTDPILVRDLPVSVYLGYNAGLSPVFEGYVRDISAKIPIEVICEDAMYLLKSGEISLSYKSVKLSQLLADLIGDKVPYRVVADHSLGRLRIHRATRSKVIDELRQKYFIKMFFRAGVLYAGLAIVPELQSTHRIKFELQVIENSLEFRRKEDIRIKLKGIIINRDNSKKEVEVGDDDGEVRTFHYYDVPVNTVNDLLKKEAERLKYDGYRGSFTTFGYPQVKHGDIVELTSDEYPERDGSYVVKKVDMSFGMNGFRQTIEIESRV